MLLIPLIFAAVVQSRWLINLSETNHTVDCTDVFSGFKHHLNVPKDFDVISSIKTRIVNYLLYKTLTDRLPWSAEDSLEPNASSTYSVKGLPPLTSTSSKSPRAGDKDHERLLGKSTLNSLRNAVQGYFDHKGFFTSIFSSSFAATSDTDDVDYFDSPFVERLMDVIIKSAHLSFLPTLSLEVYSTMRNLGTAVCQKPEESELGASVNDNYVCATYALVEQGLICNARLGGVDCSSLSAAALPPEQSSCSLSTNVTQTIDSFKFEPDMQLSLDGSVSEEQGNHDRWLLYGINKHAKLGSACGEDIRSNVVLPGWEIISDAWLNYTSLPNFDQVREQSTFSLLLQSEKSSCDFIILNRGSLFKSDWTLDFDYELVPLQYYRQDFVNGTGDDEAYGLFTKGYRQIALQTTKQFEKDMRRAQCSSPRSITIAGHSMGGIIGAAQALLFTSIYEKAPIKPQISLIAFGAPAAIDDQFATRLKEKVLVRSWEIEFDPVTRIPCHNEIPFCTLTSSSQITRHSSLPNTIVLVNAMPHMGQDSFGKVSFDLLSGEVNLDEVKFPGPTLIAQAHTCAYTCWFEYAYCSVAQAGAICERCSAS